MSFFPNYFATQSCVPQPMKILLAEHFGMCFGVRDAIAQAETLALSRPLTILGELVHNPLVRKRLRAQGVEESSPDGTNTVATPDVMITAHGASDVRRKEWRAAGYTVADGTCPLVRHLTRNSPAWSPPGISRS